MCLCVVRLCGFVCLYSGFVRFVTFEGLSFVVSSVCSTDVSVVIGRFGCQLWFFVSQSCRLWKTAVLRASFFFCSFLSCLSSFALLFACGSLLFVLFFASSPFSRCRCPGVCLFFSFCFSLSFLLFSPQSSTSTHVLHDAIPISTFLTLRLLGFPLCLLLLGCLP